MPNEAGYLTDATGAAISATNPLTIGGTGTPGVPSTAAESVQSAVVSTSAVVSANVTPVVGPLAISGLSSVVLAVNTTGFSGSVVLTPQISYDSGTSWTGVTALQIDVISGVATTMTITTVSHSWLLEAIGATHVRVNSSAYASGGSNPTVTLTGVSGDSATRMVSQVSAQNGTAINAGSATNISAASPTNSLMVITAGEIAVTHSPAANTQATASVTAGGGTVRHVCRSITASFAAGATAGAATQINLRDGATGAGTILRSWILAAPVGDSRAVSETNLQIFGTANTAMTLEFVAAGGATTLESVSFSYINAS